MVTVVAGLTIGSLAERTGCKVPTIRYYEEIGLLPKPSRLPGGHRVYAEGDLKRLTFIRRCRDLGFPIEQIRDLVALTDNPGRDCTEAKDLAEAHLVAVRSQIARAKVIVNDSFAFHCELLDPLRGGGAGL